MRIYILTFVALALFTACSVTRNISTEGFSIEGNIVSYKSVPMAELKGIEFALDNGKFVREMTFKLMPGSNNSVINNLIVFLHEKHPDYEIEVEIDVENFKDLN
ncbi:MAG: hypothetical protein RIT43_1500 [Bacteroidota bacterium]|jgi:hypothetical protein